MSHEEGGTSSERENGGRLLKHDEIDGGNRRAVPRGLPAATPLGYEGEYPSYVRRFLDKADSLIPVVLDLDSRSGGDGRKAWRRMSAADTTEDEGQHDALQDFPCAT